MGMAIIVHGGSGDIKEVDAYRRGVEIAAQIGWDILRDRGRAMDAVQTAIVSMEDDPAFDAGFGSFLNREGEVEMDASVMEGRTLDAGAVAGVKRIKNPIVLARRVLQSEHTFLIADGAEQFAQENGIALVTNESMRAPAQIAQWREWKINPPPAPIPISRGTVGCVALDRDGNIAAGTSTGGTKFKRAGRVGDSPLIGCGTFADNGLGGASATGWGEAITRVVLAKFAVDALANDRDPKLAAQIAIDHLAHRVGGTGGIILADRSGRVGFAFNTPRMARAFIHDGLRSIVADC